MFFTRENDETPFGAGICEGLKSWRFVRWQMGSHWFLVTVVVLIDGDRCTDTLMISRLEDIASLAASGAESSEVTQVQLVSAPYMNQTKQWTMEPLTQIIEGFLPGEGDKIVHVLKCRNSTIYIDEDVLVRIPQLIKPKVIFSDAS